MKHWWLGILAGAALFFCWIQSTEARISYAFHRQASVQIVVPSQSFSSSNVNQLSLQSIGSSEQQIMQTNGVTVVAPDQNTVQLGFVQLASNTGGVEIAVSYE